MSGMNDTKDDASSSTMIERMTKELRNWTDPRIDVCIHQSSLGENCGCYQCVWKRSKKLVEEFDRSKDVQRPPAQAPGEGGKDNDHE